MDRRIFIFSYWVFQKSVLFIFFHSSRLYIIINILIAYHLNRDVHTSTYAPRVYVLSSVWIGRRKNGRRTDGRRRDRQGSWKQNIPERSIVILILPSITEFVYFSPNFYRHKCGDKRKAGRSDRRSPSNPSLLWFSCPVTKKKIQTIHLHFMQIHWYASCGHWRTQLS